MDINYHGQIRTVDGRLETIIAWLLENQHRLSSDRLQIVFDCAGRSVSVEIKERYRVDATLGGGALAKRHSRQPR